MLLMTEGEAVAGGVKEVLLPGIVSSRKTYVENYVMQRTLLEV